MAIYSPPKESNLGSIMSTSGNAAMAVGGTLAATGIGVIPGLVMAGVGAVGSIAGNIIDSSSKLKKSNYEEQYKALMNNGLSFAKQYKLRPGIALTEAQIAQLTSDIVWLEEKTVKLADGTTTQALVPQVYVKARVGDLKGDGTLISADSIQLDVKGDVFNSGTIAGRQAVVLNAENVEILNGRIQANQVGLNTKKDLNIIGGQIQAEQAVDLNVGRNFNLESSFLLPLFINPTIVQIYSIISYKTVF